MRESVFAVDDSPLNLAIVEKGLKDHFDVMCFNSGEKLLEALKVVIPSMILLDIEMPGMDGFQVLEILKQNALYANIPVLMLSGLTDEKIEIKGFELGVRFC